MRRERILLLPVGDERVASVRYRVLAHRPALAAAGFDTTVRWPRRPRLADLLRDSLSDGGATMLFVHRKTYPPPFHRVLRKRGRPVVFDFDDAIDLPPPGRDLDDAAARRYRSNFDATVSAADLVICGNAELARRLPHDRREILATPIDTDRFRPGAVEPPKGPVAGWVGHSDNLGYLVSLAEPLREVARRHPGFRLVVVADRPVEIPGIDVEFRRWRLEDELSCFSGIAVGLMPLEDTPWARSKCAFKAIQYMALGIPAVASPVGMNVEVIRDGGSGFLPADAAGWVRAIDSILADRELASRIGAEGRRTIVRDYSLEVVGRRLIGLLSALA